MRYLVLAVALSGCGSAPLDIPVCDSSVILCGDSQTRDGLRCASCTNPDVTLSCQSAEHERVVCVSDCHTCDHEPTIQDRYNVTQLDVVGIHACGHEDYGTIPSARNHSWCAICSDYDLTMTTKLCVNGDLNICDPVVCVRTCDSCDENIVGQKLR